MHRFDAAVVFTWRLHRLRQLSRFAECAMAQTAVAAAEDSAFEAAAIATIITTIASPSYLSPAAAAATEAPCARHRRHATVSSASLRSPWGRAPSGAWVHAGSMPPAHVLCRLRAMDAHKQQHGSGSRRQQAAHVDAAAARSVVMPLSRAQFRVTHDVDEVPGTYSRVGSISTRTTDTVPPEDGQKTEHQPHFALAPSNIQASRTEGSTNIARIIAQNKYAGNYENNNQNKYRQL